MQSQVGCAPSFTRWIQAAESSAPYFSTTRYSTIIWKKTSWRGLARCTMNMRGSSSSHGGLGVRVGIRRVMRRRTGGEGEEDR